MLAVEQQIVDLARGRLLANTREFRELTDLGVASIGCLARVVHLKQIKAVRKRMRLVDFEASVDFSHLKERNKQRHVFADMTLTAPILVYVNPMGMAMMLDGAQRLKSLVEFVDVIFIEEEAVRRYCIGDPIKANYRILELLTAAPIGASSGRYENATEVQISSEHGELKKGGQRLSPESLVLRTHFYKYVNDLIDIEYHIYRRSRSHHLIPGARPDLQRSEWVKWFYWQFVARSELSPFPRLQTIHNKARAATANLTKLKGRPALKKAAEKDWFCQGIDALVIERDTTARICVAVLKAFFRSKTSPAAERHLFKREFDGKRLTRKEIEDTVLGQRYFHETQLSLEDQLLVTHVTGVNAARLYYDYTGLDPLFEAYRFAYEVMTTVPSAAEVDASMIETVLHRRALAILGQQDALTETWEALFEHWAAAGIDDREILRILGEVDRAYGHYAPTLMPIYLNRDLQTAGASNR